MYENEADVSISDLSRKLKRMVYVDENENKYHNYSSTSLSSLMSINVQTGNEAPSQTMSNSAYERKHSSNILSDHLRRHAVPNGLVRPLPGLMPPVKAIFESKFTDCSFPIGVRCDKSRNWLFVCDSSTNSVKVFDNKSGKLIHQIDEYSTQYQGKITLWRPSAALINNDDGKSEVYVKDDKEIFVFDLANKFEFLRKFGFKILRKPYGLAYDSKMNLVLIDADVRNPLIYVFDKYSGKVISSQPYQPILPKHVNACSLVNRFGSVNAMNESTCILGRNISQFDKTKIRFIYCHEDSLYASDLGRSIVYKTNLIGEIQMAFGHFGRQRGEFREPSGIHVESDGQAILVGDSRNDRLQVRLVFLFSLLKCHF